MPDRLSLLKAQDFLTKNYSTIHPPSLPKTRLFANQANKASTIHHNAKNTVKNRNLSKKGQKLAENSKNIRENKRNIGENGDTILKNNDSWNKNIQGKRSDKILMKVGKKKVEKTEKKMRNKIEKMKKTL